MLVCLTDLIIVFISGRAMREDKVLAYHLLGLHVSRLLLAPLVLAFRIDRFTNVDDPGLASVTRNHCTLRTLMHS